MREKGARAELMAGVSCKIKIMKILYIHIHQLMRRQLTSEFSV